MDDLDYLKRRARTTDDPDDIMRYRREARRHGQEPERWIDLPEGAITEIPDSQFVLVELDEAPDYDPDIRDQFRLMTGVYLIDTQNRIYIASSQPSWLLIPLYSNLITLLDDESLRDEIDMAWLDAAERSYYNPASVRRIAIQWYPIDIDEFDHLEIPYDQLLDELAEYFGGNHML